jgi:Mn-dependent DtxR family transcriptional regulator
MILELTDAKRYELEKDNVTNIVLAANRRGKVVEESDIARALNIDLPTVNKLITKLQTDNILK